VSPSNNEIGSVERPRGATMLDRPPFDATHDRKIPKRRSFHPKERRFLFFKIATQSQKTNFIFWRFCNDSPHQLPHQHNEFRHHAQGAFRENRISICGLQK
jgi:hypothetical protein